MRPNRPSLSSSTSRCSMKWEDRQESENVEDQRGMGKTGVAVAGGGGILVLILALIFGVDPQKLTAIIGQGNGANQGASGEPAERPVDPEEERQASFSKVVFRDTEIVWDELFQRMGK